MVIVIGCALCFFMGAACVICVRALELKEAEDAQKVQPLPTESREEKLRSQWEDFLSYTGGDVK